MNFADFINLMNFLNSHENNIQRLDIMRKTLINMNSKKQIPIASEDKRVIFAWIGDEPEYRDKTIYLRHSENGWERDGYLGRYYDSEIRLAIRNFNGAEKILYKFESDFLWFHDPINSSVEWDGTTGELLNSRMNSVIHFSPEPSWPYGRTEMFDLEFTYEGFKVLVRNWIIFPPDYDRHLSSYPLMLLSFGEHYATHFELSSLPALLMQDNTIAEFPLIVLVSSEITERGREIPKEEIYSPKGILRKLMENYFANFIICEIEQRYRTKRNPAYRTIGGFKAGALFALNVGLNYPNVFSNIACQSLDEKIDPALIPDFSKDSPVSPPVMYFDCGESGSLENIRETASILRKKGYKYTDIAIFKDQTESPEEIKSRLKKLFEKLYGRFPLGAERYYD
ncbi:hypothetical protein JW890_03280 [candidate division WOR-3 bacterium]|nr:hypothetical protein [candidate division WOR-3 bacterium]